jgi:tetratricopeptide (TPR) repeat protein
MLRRLREEYRESEPLLKSGLEMRLALFDPEHPDVIIAREQWAQSLAALGRYAEARAVFIEALEWGIPVVGTNHPDIRSVREGLASVERALGEYDQAFARLDTVRGHKIEALGDSHPGVVVTLIYMGEIALRAGRLDTSEELFDEALGMGGDLGEPEGVYASLAITGLTEIALEQGDLAKAQSLYATAEAISSDALRPGHRYRLELQRVGAQVHMATGRPDLAVELLRGVRMAEEAVRPTPHPRLGETDLLLGRALAALGELEEARTAYRSALAEFAALPDGHPARVEALAGIADPGTGVTGAPAR